MSNNKMKGLLKGLRYISHIFENEKEPEMQIGFPTDVKHVAHIGRDGPAVNSPSWMNEFTEPPGFQSAHLNGGDKKDDSFKWVSQDSTSSRRSSRGQISELPKSSRRHASTGESPTRERSEKSKQSRRPSKNSNKDLSESTKSKGGSQGDGGESPHKRPDMPKKSRRKKSKDYAEGSSRSSTRSSRRANGSKSDSVSECGSVSGSLSKGNKDDLSETSGLNPSGGGEEKGFREIS